ncbi:MAG: DUF1638 domain-containing protein [Anaerolineales bacterium]|nr:DUF1638 domain-containing protein [Anaerolineales bacterium]
MPSASPLPVVVISCKVFQHLLEAHLPPETARATRFLDYGLHRVPRNLHKAVQEQVDSIQEPSLIVLGYGLCGNGLNGIRAGKHTLLVPRADDCIAILLGSYPAYQHEFFNHPATYYLTKGWLESGSHPLNEYREYTERYGQKRAAWVMDQQYHHYERLVLVAHNQDDLARYRPQAQEIAAYCARWGMRYEEILGTQEYVQRLVETALALEKAGEDFVVVPPGGEIRQERFMR